MYVWYVVYVVSKICFRSFPEVKLCQAVSRHYNRLIGIDLTEAGAFNSSKASAIKSLIL